jgi:putative peptidoglycan binding protein
MKTKGLVFITCLAAGALIASPALAKPEKKSAGASTSKQKRTSPQTTQVMPGHRYQQNRQKVSSHIGNTRYYAGTRYGGSRNYVVPQYRGRTYYGSNGYYGGNNAYYGGTGYYGVGSAYPYYSYYSNWPYSNWGYGTSGGYYPYSYWGGYPSNSYNNYSYYTQTYGYNPSLVSAVQRRLGQFGYYHGVVDGVIGPRTRGAIVAFESRNGLVVDGRISRPLLDTLGLG